MTAEIAAHATDRLEMKPEVLDEAPAVMGARVVEEVELRLKEIEQALGVEPFAEVAAQIMLSTIDKMWTEHLGELELLDEEVGLRSYGQLDPLLEFKKESHLLYQSLLRQIRGQILASVCSIVIAKSSGR